MAATDAYTHEDVALDSPAVRATVVTPHATNELAYVTRGLYVGTGGHISVIMAQDSSAVTFMNVPNGTTLAFRVKAVRVSGTTASDIVALY